MSQEPATLFDARALLGILPHRYPFLLVDRIVELTDDRVVGLKNVTWNEPHFPGHFPGHPVMPGVLILEALAQTGAVLACKATGFDPEKQVIYFMGIDKAKFRRPAIPGDQLILDVVPLRRGSSVWKLRGEARVGSEIVCEAELLATITARPGI